MSMLQFIRSPFPDNHDGFDYAPKSFMEQQRELDDALRQKENVDSQKKLMSMFASIFK